MFLCKIAYAIASPRREKGKKMDRNVIARNDLASYSTR